LKNGITQTEYEPYFYKEYDYEKGPLRSLPNGIKDTIEKDGIHRRVGKVILNGTENWAISSNTYKGLHYFTTTNIKDFNNSVSGRPLNIFRASHFHYVSGGGSADFGGAYFINSLFLVFMNFDNVLDFKSWLSTNNVEVIYELKEEVIEPIFKEYVPYGEYTVTKYEDLKSNKKYKIVAYDNMDKLNVEFKNNTSFVFNPTSKAEYTLKDFYTDFMDSYGIEVEQQTLPNENFVVTEMPNFEGYTARSILMRIAEIFGSFAKINRENKCQMYLKTDTDIQIELSTMNSKLEIDKQYGPVNVVSIGMSNVEGENVTKIDAESIAEYGETTIKIDDNPFLYTEDKRESVINDLYDRLHNFTYIPVKFNLKALMYTDCGDAIQVRNMENTDWISTMILNQNINVPRTRQSVIETKALTNTERTNKYISQSKQQGTRTEILVDKQNQLINSLIETTTALDENTSMLSADMQNKLDELGQVLTDFQLTVSTQFSQTNTSFEMQFNQLLERIINDEGNNNNEFTEIRKYIRFVDGNIILGESDNELTLTIQNDRISYQQNGSEVAYFSNNKLYVKTLEVIESLQLGNFAFTPRANGSLSFGKVV